MLNKVLEWSVAKFLIGVIKALTDGYKEPKPVKVSNVDLIKESEGLRLEAYMPTPNDKWTIGYGHTSGVFKGQKITEAQAEIFLKEDLKWVDEVINERVKVPINQNQYDALASLIFNIGEGNFVTSSVLRFLNSGDYLAAADHFVLWNKQRNKTTGKLEVLNGLTIRRRKEKELFLK